MCLKPVEPPPLTLLCLLPPCDWPVWHHLTTHQTATFSVPARRSARVHCGCQRACWRWPPSPPSPACGHTQKNNVSSAAAGQNFKTGQNTSSSEINIARMPRLLILTRWPLSCQRPSPHSSGHGRLGVQVVQTRSNNNPPKSWCVDSGFPEWKRKAKRGRQNSQWEWKAKTRK